jgi:hypothetical protein
MGAQSLENLVDELSREHEHLRDVLPKNNQRWEQFFVIKKEIHYDYKRRRLENIAENSEFLFKKGIVGGYCYKLYNNSCYRGVISKLKEKWDILEGLGYKTGDIINASVGPNGAEQIELLIEVTGEYSAAGIELKDIAKIIGGCRISKKILKGEDLKKAIELGYSSAFLGEELLSGLDGPEWLRFILDNEIEVDEKFCPMKKIVDYLKSPDRESKKEGFLENYNLRKKWGKNPNKSLKDLLNSNQDLATLFKGNEFRLFGLFEGVRDIASVGEKLENLAENSKFFIGNNFNPLSALESYEGNWQVSVPCIIENYEGLRDLGYSNREMSVIASSRGLRKKIIYIFKNQSRLSKKGINPGAVTKILISSDWEKNMDYLERISPIAHDLNYSIDFLSRVLRLNEGRSRVGFLFKYKIRPNRSVVPLKDIGDFIRSGNWYNLSKKKQFLRSYREKNKKIDLESLVKKLREEHSSFGDIFSEGDVYISRWIDAKIRRTIKNRAKKMIIVAKNSDLLLKNGFSSWNCYSLFRGKWGEESFSLIADNLDRLISFGYDVNILSRIGGSTYGSHKIFHLMDHPELSDLSWKKIKEILGGIDWSSEAYEKRKDFRYALNQAQKNLDLGPYRYYTNYDLKDFEVYSGIFYNESDIENLEGESNFEIFWDDTVSEVLTSDPLNQKLLFSNGWSRAEIGFLYIWGLDDSIKSLADYARKIRKLDIPHEEVIQRIRSNKDEPYKSTIRDLVWMYEDKLIGKTRFKKDFKFVEEEVDCESDFNFNWWFKERGKKYIEMGLIGPDKLAEIVNLKSHKSREEIDKSYRLAFAMQDYLMHQGQNSLPNTVSNFICREILNVIKTYDGKPLSFFRRVRNKNSDGLAFIPGVCGLIDVLS